MLNVKNIFRTAGFMIIATLLAKLMGMYRDILFASLYGTGDIANAYLTASRIPLLFFDITLGAAISSSFIPVFNEYLEKGQKEEALRYSNCFVTLIVLITGLLCVLGMVFSSQLVGVIGSGFAGNVKELASTLVVILFPTMIFTGLAYALSGVLQSYGEFNVPAAISLVSNGIMVVYLLVVKDKLGIEGVAFAMLVGWGFQVIIQIPALVKKKYRYRPVLDLRSEGIRKSAKLALPILISSWVQPINTMININLASGLNGGMAVAALDYANKLYIIFVGVLTYAISNLIFPSISRMAASGREEDKQEFNQVVMKAVRVVMMIILPVMVLFLLLRVPIVQFVYERGEFDATSTALTSQALLFYSLGMLGFAVQEILNKAFYSMQDGKTPMYIAMGGIAVNIVISLLLVKLVGTGLEGLAFAASVASTLIASALLFMVQRRRKVLNRDFWVNLLKLFACAAVMGVSVYFVRSCFSFEPSTIGKLLNLILPALVGLVVYLLMAVLLRVEEIVMLPAILKRKK